MGYARSADPCESGLNLVKTQRVWDMNFYDYTVITVAVKSLSKAQLNKDNWHGRTQINLPINHDFIKSTQTRFRFAVGLESHADC